jgi:hypothetical protein
MEAVGPILIGGIICAFIVALACFFSRSKDDE